MASWYPATAIDEQNWLIEVVKIINSVFNPRKSFLQAQAGATGFPWQAWIIKSYQSKDIRPMFATSTSSILAPSRCHKVSLAGVCRLHPWTLRWQLYWLARYFVRGEALLFATVCTYIVSCSNFLQWWLLVAVTLVLVKSFLTYMIRAWLYFAFVIW